MLKSIICIVVGIILILISGPASSGEREMDEMLNQLIEGYKDTATIRGQEYSCSNMRRSLYDISMRAFMDKGSEMTKVLTPTFLDSQPMSYETFQEILEPSIDRATGVAVEDINNWMVQCIGEALSKDELAEYKREGKTEAMNSLHEPYLEYLRLHAKVHHQSAPVNDKSQNF